MKMNYSLPSRIVLSAVALSFVPLPLYAMPGHGKGKEEEHRPIQNPRKTPKTSTSVRVMDQTLSDAMEEGSIDTREAPKPCGKEVLTFTHVMNQALSDAMEEGSIDKREGMRLYGEVSKLLEDFYRKCEEMEEEREEIYASTMEREELKVCKELQKKIEKIMEERKKASASTMGNSEKKPASKTYGKYRIEDLFRLGPLITPLNQGEDSVEPVVEPVSMAAKAKAKVFDAARKHDIDSILRVAQLHRDKGDYREALSWYVLALGCEFSATLFVPADHRIYKYMNILSEKINGTLPKKSRGKGKRKNKVNQGEIKEKRGLVKKITRLVNSDKFSLANTPEHNSEEMQAVRTEHYMLSSLDFLRSFIWDATSNNNKENYYKFIAFVGLASSNTGLLTYLAEDLRCYRSVSQNHEPLLFNLEKQLLRRVNSKKCYHSFGERYLVLGQTKELSKPADKGLTERERYERAEELFLLSQHPDALHALGIMYKEKKLGQELSTNERLQKMKDCFERAGEAGSGISFTELGVAYLEAAIEVAHVRRKANGVELCPEEDPLSLLEENYDIELSKIDEGDLSRLSTFYLQQSEIYLSKTYEGDLDSHRLLHLGRLYSIDRNFTQAEAAYLQEGSVESLSMLARLYIGARLGGDLPEQKRFELARQYFQASIDVGQPSPQPLFNMGLLYSKNLIAAELSQEERLRKGIELYKRASMVEKHPSIVEKDYQAYKILIMRNISLNYMLLLDYAEAEAYALKAQALGSPMEDIFDMIKSVESEDSSSSDEQEPAIALSTPQMSAPAETVVITDSAISPSDDEFDTAAVSTSAAPTPEDSVVSPEALNPTQASRESSVTVAQPRVKTKRSERKKAEKKHAQMLRNQAKVQAMINKEEFEKSCSLKTLEKKWTHSNAIEILDEAGNDRTRKYKLSSLFYDILCSPGGLQGIGKPEELKWEDVKKRYGITVYSRRITHEDRLTYVLDPKTLQVHFLTWEGHYEGLELQLERYLRASQKQQEVVHVSRGI